MVVQILEPLRFKFFFIFWGAGLYGGRHENGESKSRKAAKAAGAKGTNWRAGACVGRPRKVQTAEASVHATKHGRCQKERKTAVRTLPAAPASSAIDATASLGRDRPSQGTREF